MRGIIKTKWACAKKSATKRATRCAEQMRPNDIDIPSNHPTTESPPHFGKSQSQRGIAILIPFLASPLSTPIMVSLYSRDQTFWKVSGFVIALMYLRFRFSPMRPFWRGKRERVAKVRFVRGCPSCRRIFLLGAIRGPHQPEASASFPALDQ